jgi:iron complex outermembrane recepter protein
MFYRFNSVLLMIISMMLSPTLFADNVLEEIVVTAGFRAVPLMKSTGSISVLDDAVIKDRAARHFDETINTLPNVNFSGGGSRARFVQIRGVGDLEQFVDPKNFPSVGITLDGVEVGTRASSAVLMDVEQIELLRGPQGTKFGANALAGIINIHTKAPTDTFKARFETGYGNFNTWHVGATVSGPLSDSVKARLAVQQNKSDGYYKNSFLSSDDNNARDELSVRGKLNWLANNRAEVNVTASHTELNSGYDAFSLDNVRSTRSDNPGRDNHETTTLSVQASVPVLEGVSFESIISWRDTNEDYAFDEDWIFSGFCDGVVCDPLLEFSNTDEYLRDSDVPAIDLRLKSDPARLSWVAGFYAQNLNEDLLRQYFGPFSSDYETQRYAVYGQLQYELTNTLSLTAGFRFEHFEDEYNDSNNLITNSSDNYWSGQLSLEYLLGDSSMLYATLSRSVKPGGVNTETSSNFPNITASFQPFLLSRQQFSPETLFNKEIGIKGSYLDDSLAIRLSVFHMDRDNAQLESFVFDANTFIFTGFLDSSSDAENYGAELEIDYQLSQQIELFANIGYLETSVDELTVFDLDTSQFVSRSNREQTKAPNWQYNLGLNFDLNDNLHGRFEVEGRDKSFFGYYHNGQIGSYTLAHASLSYQIGDFSIQTWVRNLFDENYQTHGLYFGNDPRDGYVNKSYYQFGEPRVYGVNLSYSF